jgi:MtN3 and saliva related transmembrane protein
MISIDGIGLVAAILTTTSFIPQAYKVYKTRKTEDLSLGMFLLFTLGVFLWFIYGLLLYLVPVILANLVTLMLTFYILVMKIKHG